MDKWVERWAVRSSSGGNHIIARDTEGNYACDCMGWTRHMYCPDCSAGIKKDETHCPRCGCVFGGKYNPVRHDCVHITEVKTGRGRSIGEATIDRMLGR
jgi:predicted nucleic acid-binding Zn ribbon protein